MSDDATVSVVKSWTITFTIKSKEKAELLKDAMYDQDLEMDGDLSKLYVVLDDIVKGRE